MKYQLRRKIAIAIASITFSGFVGAATYTTTLLDQLASGINNAGQVVGTSSPVNGPVATIWNGTMTTNFDTLGGTHSSSSAINNTGQVVGWTDTSYGNFYHATL